MRSGTLAIAKRVLKNHLADRGMAVFYLCGALAAAVVLPFFVAERLSQMLFIAAFPTLILKQWACEGIAGEKQAGTLEPLLSTRVTQRALVLGNMLQALAGGTVLFALTLLLSLLTRRILALPFGFAPYVLPGYIVCTVCLLIASSAFGVRASALAQDPQGADGKASFFVYPALLVFLLIMTFAQAYPGLALAFYGGYSLVLLFVAAALYISAVSILRERMLQRAGGKARARWRAGFFARRGGTRPVGQFRSVLRHEFRYLRATRRFKISFVLFCLAPAIVFVLMWYYGMDANLYIPIAFLLFAAPRLPINIAAYTVAGERAYKTGESLLSTPVKTGAAFLGKAALPVIVSACIIVVSATLTLLSAHILNHFAHGGLPAYYTPDQLMMIFPIGMMISIFSVFVTVICTMLARTARQGFLLAMLIGYFFALLPIALLMLAGDKLLWSLVVFLVLLAMNLGLGVLIFKRLPREQLMRFMVK